ncbi:hypothetical protein [Nostoc sp. FACHB-888]|uniref:hypothetical protein n=1 Tax=Nostoc sp. FACHB-888 TaxID=2692842 RepID=UPI001687FE93|nr:hypothetical protein [Nostoc sp. FACHB-888]MBD2244756.1 hypothetical protein [Nostoc sp. FACHB-888]
MDNKKFFSNYKDLVFYYETLIKIEKDRIIDRIDYEFNYFFKEDDLGIRRDSWNEDMIFDSEFYFGRHALNNFRHNYSNYDVFLNQLTKAEIKKVTNLMHIRKEELVYYMEYISCYEEKHEEDEKLDFIKGKLPIRSAIYIDIKVFINQEIESICLDLIHEHFDKIEKAKAKAEKAKAKAKELQKQIEIRELENNFKTQKLKTLEIDKENLIKCTDKLHKLFLLEVSHSNLNVYKTNYKESRKWAGLIILIIPTSWLSILMFFIGVALRPEVLIFTIVFGLPYLIPLSKFFYYFSLYSKEKPIYISKVKKYKNNYYKELKKYDEIIYNFKHDSQEILSISEMADLTCKIYYCSLKSIDTMIYKLENDESF